MRGQFIHHVASTVGISVLQQFVGLARQALIAAFFGLSIEYDGYLVVYAIATIAVFNLSGVFDTVAVSRLVQIHQRDGEEAFWRGSNRLLLQASIGGVLFASGFMLLLHLSMPIIAAGFGATERTLLSKLALYFMPWVAIIIPFYAVAAHLKALWRFHWVFAAELFVMVVSIAALWCWHNSITSLPIAYGAGYLCGFMMLLTLRGVVHTGAFAPSPDLVRGMARQYFANQTGSLVSLADRYFQSFLTSGGISALGYTGQIVNNLSSLMSFREIYVAPLASEEGRGAKLGRMLCGVVLVSVPITCFVVAFAEPIVRILFQRGNFTPAATALTASVMQVLALSLLFTPVLAPMLRLFQIVGRVSYVYLLNLFWFVQNAVLLFILIFKLGWDVMGVAWAGVANSTVLTVFGAYLIGRCGIRFNWMPVFGHAAMAAAIAGAGLALSMWLCRYLEGLQALAGGVASYWLVVGAGYLLIRDRLRAIVG